MFQFLIGAQLAVLVALVIGLPVEATRDRPPPHDVRQQTPQFPQSERMRGREGWVIVEYSIEADGGVGGAVVKYSSGSRAFEDAALDAVREWSFEPGAARTTSVQIQFIYERQRARYSPTFYSKLRQVHEMIDLGKLEAASFGIWWIRNRDTVNAVENAYLLIAEGRIAERAGDPKGQLAYFRRASLSQGRWLARADYVKLLRGMTVLELQLGAHEAAIAHYEELTSTAEGRERAADLDDVIRLVTSGLAAERGEDSGFAAPDHIVSVVRRFPHVRAP